ncbi:MAG: sugar ABC transporter permease [Pseudolysinimonas sp.]
MAFETVAAMPQSRLALRRPQRGRLRRWREEAGASLFLVPVLIVFVVLFAIPMSQSVYYSFTNFNGYSNDFANVGLRNYALIFTDPTLASALGFTITYAIALTVLVTLFAIPLALILNRKFFGRNFVRSVYFFPAIPSVAILGLVWGFILNPLGDGVLNTVIHALTGLGPVPWLADSTLAQLSTIAVAVWTLTGWHALLYLAYLQSIPSDFLEAATIDGASRLQIFRFITLPLLTPAMTVSWLLLMTNGLKVYDLPITLTRGGPGFATTTITQAIIQDGIASAAVGQASALAVLFLLVVGIVVLAQLGLSRLLERKYT